ncbi:MAG: hypothetical protein HOF11_21390 [Rhodospirillaceae bacterium]|nr:hypothetical protein [Rhodospirillaceae bacterium]
MNDRHHARHLPMDIMYRHNITLSFLIRHAAGVIGVIADGLAGSNDLLGKVVTRGWLELGLPVEYGSSEDQDYETLAAKTEK